MADDHLELVRDGLASWRRGDKELMRRVFHSDVVLIDHSRPDGLEFRGYEGLLAAYRSWSDAWAEADLVWAEPALLAPGLVLAIGRLSGVSKASRIPVDREAAALYWVAGARILRAEIYATEAEAREAAARLA